MNENTKSLAALRHYFGYSAFRPGQAEIIEAIVAGQDCLAVMPTGGGKSVCFQIPGLLRGGTTIVVSPLISLMQDQVYQLEKRGITATLINSTLTPTQQQQRIASLGKGQWQFVYVAPERLQNLTFVAACLKTQINLIVIDEAHCIAEWGHDFRPSYREIISFISQFSLRPPVAAFTATATTKTQMEIVQGLGLREALISIGSFRRTNLSLHVHDCPTRLTQELLLVRLLKRYQGQSGIIYVATRVAAETLTRQLHNFHLFHERIERYHGGLNAELRAEIQTRFITNQTRIIVATNAFGMGVDKPDIRWVIHTQPSNSIENYSQEVGRAGRDGQPARCHLLFTRADQQIVSGLCTSQRQQQKFQSLLDFVQSTGCRSQYLTQYFGEKSEKCGMCDRCRPLPTLSTPTEQQRFKTLVDQRPINLPISTLKWVALLQPRTAKEYLAVPGIGQGWLAKWQTQLTKSPQGLKSTLDGT